MNEREGTAGPLSKERLRTWLRMLKATRAVEGELRERLRVTFDTTMPRFDVMAALDRAETGGGEGALGLRMSELSAALRVSNGNVTGIVDRLVEDGLVRREAVRSDRRSSRVRLTREGRRRFREMAVVHEAWVDELLSPIGGDGLGTIRGRLARLTEPEREKARGEGE